VVDGESEIEPRVGTWQALNGTSGSCGVGESVACEMAAGQGAEDVKEVVSPTDVGPAVVGGVGG